MGMHATAISCGSCGRKLTQVDGGHRKREYCNGVCRQKAFRARKTGRQLQQAWGGYAPETRIVLREIETYAGKGMANRMATAISHEYYRRGKPMAQIQGKDRAKYSASNDAIIIATERKRLAALLQEHLELMGIKVTATKSNGYILSYGTLRATGATPDMALLAFVAACLE